MFVFGTAGHIDHGKTALIYSLTSINTDRLPEEKKRGMTIDLGFAWIKLHSGETVGIVDVPGHENLIKNMIAGATGIDAVILVIDANEGWMPQTEEHFQIINLLKIKFGIIVITKVDLVNNDRLEFVEKQIKSKTINTPFSTAQIIRFSTIKNIGTGQIKKAIQNLIPKMITRKDIGKPRMSIDRVFGMKGSGTIVTGTLMNGSFYKGMEVVIFPSYKKSRIRNLQAYKEEVERALPGSRIALNLSGIEKKQLHRGDIVFGTEKIIGSSQYIDAQIELLPQQKKYFLMNRANLDFFCGTKEILTKIILNKEKYLESEKKGLVQFRFNEPISTSYGDHFIIRIPTPPKTIGGGIILDPLARKHSFKDGKLVDFLNRRLSLTLKELILTEIEKSLLIKKESLYATSNFSDIEIKSTLDHLIKENVITCTDSWLISKHFWQKQIDKLAKKLNQEHELNPFKKSFPLHVFQSYFYYLKPQIFNYLINSQAKNNKVILKNGMLSSPDHYPKIPPEKEKLMTRILKTLRDNSHNPLNEKTILLQFSRSKEIIHFLMQEEKIVRLNDGILLEKKHYDMIKGKLIQFLKTNGSISIAEVRGLLGLSRKYIIPLLTKLDEENITKRQGNNRVLSDKKNGFSKKGA